MAALMERRSEGTTPIFVKPWLEDFLT